MFAPVPPQVWNVNCLSEATIWTGGIQCYNGFLPNPAHFDSLTDDEKQSHREDVIKHLRACDDGGSYPFGPNGVVGGDGSVSEPSTAEAWWAWVWESARTASEMFNAQSWPYSDNSGEIVAELDRLLESDGGRAPADPANPTILLEVIDLLFDLLKTNHWPAASYQLSREVVKMA